MSESHLKGSKGKGCCCFASLGEAWEGVTTEEGLPLLKFTGARHRFPFDELLSVRKQVGSYPDSNRDSLNANGPHRPLMFEYLIPCWRNCLGRLKKCGFVGKVCHWGKVFEVSIDSYGSLVLSLCFTVVCQDGSSWPFLHTAITGPLKP